MTEYDLSNHLLQLAATCHIVCVLQALDHEAVLKCRQLGVYEPPGLLATDAGMKAAVKRIWWKYRCIVQVSLVGRSSTELHAVLNTPQQLVQCSIAGIAAAKHIW